jgi:D-3-phosphoglycerate dehydrogenase
MSAGGLVEAPKLDAIAGIVNMPDCQRALRRTAMPPAARHTIESVSESASIKQQTGISGTGGPPKMSVNNKRVFYVKYLAHEIYADILRARPDVRLDRLENESAEEIAAPILAAAHAYQIGAARDALAPRFHADRDLLARAPNLLIVSSNGAGYDPVDVEACTAAGVLVVNQSGGNANSVAEHALGMLLTLSKRILEADRALRRSPNVNRNALMGAEAHGKTIGIVGIGHVGRRIAELCRGLLGMKVLAYDPYLSSAEIAARGAEKVELDELLRGSDYVSISCPLTKDNRGMIGAREFAAMRPHAYFITTARGFIHDEGALVEALRDQRIAGAGLDVWASEPPPPDHPLLQFDNVLASPHTAGVTREARTNMGRIAAEQLLCALDGKRPPRIINPEVWPRYAQRFERAFGFAPA